MKEIIMAVALGALVPGASAQIQPAVEEIRISGGLPRIELPEQLHNVWQDEFDRIQGSYRLSNGKTMQLSSWGNRMYAKIDGMPRRQLAAVSPYIFVARDLQMKIRISNVDGAGPIMADVHLAQPSMAQGSSEVTLTRLIATR